MRTLVVSDLHLGARLQHGVLTRPEPLRRLAEAVHGIDRLVLLGDVVELLEGRPEHAMAVAEPLLRTVGEQLEPGSEVVIVPGNHDRALIRSWLRGVGARLQVDSVVPPDATPLLARLTSWFAGTGVRVHYPGVWLSDRVWATHGHYLDRHLLPESAFGIARGLLGRPPRDGALPVDYERARRPSTARVNRWLPRPALAAVDDLAELIRAASMPQIRRRLLHRRIAPLTSTLLGRQMLRASIPALGRVVHRLGVEADWVVFGHVHRAGPLTDDDPRDWLGPDTRPRLVNTGSWLYEPLLVHRATPPHPYWPGAAVLLEPSEDPRVIGLLDGVEERDLR